MIGNGARPADGRPTDGRPRGASGASWSFWGQDADGYAGTWPARWSPDGSLEEAADVLAVDPEADDAARAVDLIDRVGRDEPAAAREEARLDREGVRDVRGCAVHRALDLADEATL